MADADDRPSPSPPASAAAPAPAVEPEVARPSAPPAAPAPAAHAPHVSLLRDRRLVLALVGVIVVTLFVRLARLPMVETGGDALKVWFNAKQLTLGIADRYWAWDHHSVRFALIIPTYVIQQIFGMSPQVYYVIPLLTAVAQGALLFAVAHRLGRPAAGFVAALAILAFPEMGRSAGQLLSEGPSAVIATLGVYLVLRYRDEPPRRVLYAVLLGVLLFLGWITKVTNVLLVPAFGVALWAVARRWRDAALSLGLVAALFVVETLLYRTLAGFPLGEISIVRGTHLADRRLKPTPFSEFFTHVLDLSVPWKVTLILFVVACVFAFVQRKKLTSVWLVAFIPASFLLLQNFAVKSIHPLVPVQRFLPRYLTPPLPLMFLAIALVLGALLAEARRRWAPDRKLGTRAMAGLAVATMLGFTIFGAVGLKKGLHDNPLILLGSYDKKANKVFAKGAPAVGFRNLKDTDLFLKFLWDGLRHEGPGLEMPPVRTGKVGKSNAYFAIHPKHAVPNKKDANQAYLDGWVGKEAVLLDDYRYAGPNMGRLFKMSVGKLDAKAAAKPR